MKTGAWWKTAVLLLFAWYALPVFASEPAHGDPTDAFPYDLAFDMRTLRSNDDPVASPHGDQVAYVVVAPHGARPMKLTGFFLPNGTPYSALGAHIHIVAVDGKSPAGARAVCDARGSQWAPSWSPDGRMLAFYSDADGPVQVWSYSLESHTCRRIAAAVIRGSVLRGSEPKWSPDGRWVYVPLDPHPPGSYGDATPPGSGSTTSDVDMASKPPVLFFSGKSGGAPGKHAASGFDERDITRVYNVTLAAIDTRSGEVRTLVPADVRPRPSRLELSPSGRWLSYESVLYRQKNISVDYVMDLAALPAAGGPPRIVAKGLSASKHRVNYLQLDYRWHPSEDKLFYLKDGGLWSVTFDKKGPRAPKRMALELGELAPVILYFTRDGRAVVVGIEATGAGRDRVPQKLAIVPLDGGSPTVFALPDNAKWQFLDMVRANEDVLWQPDGRYVSAVVRERDSGEQAVIRMETATGRIATLDKGLHRIGKFTAAGDHERLVAVYEDVATPPNLYRYSANLSRGARLSTIDSRLEGRRYGTAKVIETRTPQHDGSLATVRTLLLLPPGAKRGDLLPGIVMVYPGTDLSTSASFFGGGMGNTVPNQIFTSRGYAVIMTDVVLGPTGVAGYPLQQMTDEVLAQTYALADAGYVDIDRLAISGQSYGGYSTAAIASQTHLFRAAIPVNGSFDLASFYGDLNEHGDSYWVRWTEKGQGRMGDSLWANPLRYIDNSPFYRVDRIRTPMLIVTGDKDETVPYTQSKKLFVGLRRLELPAQLAIYPDEGHIIYLWSKEHAVDASRRMVKFLDEHLGNPGSGNHR